MARNRIRRHAPALLALLVSALLAGHALVPNAGPRLGSLLETFLPWTGAVVPPLLLFVLLRRRTPVAVCAVLLPALTWAWLFGPHLLPRDDHGADLTVVQHNVSDENPDPAATARALARPGPDLIALQEVTSATLPVLRSALSADYPHHASHGTVALFSRHPLTDVRPLDIRPAGVDPSWQRALRATAHLPRHGEIAVHVAHLPSVRITPTAGLTSARRDESARLLAAEIDAETLPRVLLLGDLNSTLDDRGLSPLTSRLPAPVHGLAFTWPASLPLARIDQALARGPRAIDVTPLPGTPSDHLPLLARIRL
ncbi:endonuclease/exonuclease/phosphatase family protein [Streptomyces sp. UH6]|uniref:endonuclease/exonuclease/phosphatase family protein n=1 Tax=Streptomyces sp. UH6 TaxID=2748379 RepID=UPI0015D47D09|nr:endonuclease/exonuclease/phosphatase family protein [Streptomyces sp. UH6]NYV77433.1 endonuclease/exonuclease/phosphatase family protein [Streptomyces sp. UH6]